MAVDKGAYTAEEFKDALSSRIAFMTASLTLRPERQPQAYLLGGQSGAGKTTLHGILSDRFRQNVIIINGDEYRAFHPRYRELDAEYGPECVNYTAEWAGKMTEALIDALSLMGYNLVIEGTLRTREVPMRTATLLRERGYAVSLACMAVKPEISLVSCQIRYQRMRLAGTVPRATDLAHHDKIVHDIVENIAELEQCGLFDEISLYDRAGERLYPDGAYAFAAESAGKTLGNVHFGTWTSQEKMHYEYLTSELEKLEAM